MIDKSQSPVYWLLHIPLYYKIVLTNIITVGLGVGAGTFLATLRVTNLPEDSDDLIILYALAGFLVALGVNSLLLWFMLAPLSRLRQGLDSARQGKEAIRVRPGLFSDDQFDRLAVGFNQLQSTQEQYVQQLHHLSQAILRAQEEERQRIARELHDETAQILTSLLLYLKILEKSESPDELQRIQNLRQLTLQALEEIRRVALELHPKILADWGLQAVLGWRVDQLSQAHSIEATLQVSGLRARLPKDLETVFYRVAQEAIANVIQHADAHHVGIVLALEGDWLTLEVRDDGVGFDTRLQDQPSDRLGILGMRERLALVHGELAIESQPGCCTRLIARAPVPQPIIGGQDGQDSGTAR